ncbi:hypothetical protein HZY91_01670 [Facklamia sp. DSM 111018]|uniref:Flavodoxin domain-containing protein n=1 Tax=Facklamia lactis TaxID=2749967 RepID=A0ABS0LNB1_9LACT|nr:flavodoxin domain-containing protein [Facklamia lactis]MBG9979722.1 hypothetical protein [Facklamia lactis]MBG9985598.1 hypothetical protein [Facklamia lactis]
MTKIVVYYSKYGYTEKYANWIADTLACPCVPLDQVSQIDFSKIKTLILGSSLYAGTMKGSKLLDEHLDKNLIAFSVGLRSPSEAYFTEIIENNFSKEVRDKVHFYQFQGGMNFKELSFIHRLLMRGIKKFTFDKVPVAERDEQFTKMLDCYYESFDFSDRSTIQPLIEQVDTL